MKSLVTILYTSYANGFVKKVFIKYVWIESATFYLISYKFSVINLILFSLVMCLWKYCSSIVYKFGIVASLIINLGRGVGGWF